MKKSIILALFMTLAVSLSAHHVTPITVNLTEFNLDSLRAQYSGSSYLLELQRLDKLMKDDTKALKDAQVQLKAEKDYYKQMSSYIDKAESSFKSLQTYSQKELDEINKLKDQADKQIRTLNSSSQINPDTRKKALDILLEQRKGLEEAVTGTTKRQTEYSSHPTELQKIRTELMVLNNELTNKETDLKQMEATLKSRREIIKSEMKNVKAQK